MRTVTTGETPTSQPVGPYAAAAETYWRAGWRGILPLPVGEKTPVPKGYTGADGLAISYPDLYGWIELKGHGNVALRLPPDVIGVDVDHYDGKPGGLVIDELEKRLGALPATWRSTSRDDGQSGIRLYRIPPGLRWPGTLGPGVDVIRYDHRYVVSWPSIHPNGGVYRWITPGGVVALSDVPDPSLLPALPSAWVEHFTAGEMAAEQPRANLTDQAALSWLDSRSETSPCRVTESALAKGLAELTVSATRHETALAASNRLVWLAGDGHVGTSRALAVLGARFVEMVGPDRGPREASEEWSRMVAGAVRMTVAAHPDGPPSDPCTDPQVPDVASGHHEVTKRFLDGGSFILDIPEHVPAVWGSGENVLWAAGEALTLCGPPGVGKTTLTAQVLRARMVGGEVLDMPVAVTGSKVLYLAMDRPRQIARALRRTLGDLPREVLAERLIVWPGPPVADVAAHPETLMALVDLAGADTLIVDSIKDAAVGLSNDEVGAGYNRARQLCIAEGIEVLEQHHMVKRGDNGSAPTSLADLYGSVWIGAGSGSVVLLSGVAGDPIVSMRHLKTPAEEVGPMRLIHDHERGRTSIWHATDLVAMARLSGSMGLTAKAAAASLFDKDNPDRNDVKKAERRLAKLVESGHLMHREGMKGGSGGGIAATWLWLTDSPLLPVDNPVDKGVQSDPESDPARDRAGIAKNRARTIPREDKAAGQSDVHTDPADPAGSDPVSSPPYKGGGTDAQPRRTPIAGGKYLYDHGTGATIDPTTGEVVTP